MVDATGDRIRELEIMKRLIDIETVQSELLGQFRLISDRASDVSGAI